MTRMPSEDLAPSPFAAFGLNPKLLVELAQLGYEEPTPIQAEAIPPLVAGKDLIGQAATGTGKTAAFALPLLQGLSSASRTKSPTALVLVPTRELCMQVSEAVHRYGRGLGVRVLPIYGGQPIVRQLRELQRGVDIVVATPGRTVDHLKRGSLDLDSIRTVVLDEADEMLDMGFADELEAILEATPRDRQTVLFSATMPARINSIARKHLTDPVRIEIARSQSQAGTAPKVDQRAYVVARAHKSAALSRLLDMEAPNAALVFCRTRAEVDGLTETLNGRGYRAASLHGGMDQNQRDKTMGRFQAEGLEVLVATDVAARGLDIDHLTHVFNYDVPSAPESYVHRIGRVGRGGRTGVAITLVEPREHRMLKTIESMTKQRIPIGKLPSTADLLAQRLELTRLSLVETLVAEKYEPYRVLVESMTDDYDVMQVAMAAVQLAHEASAASVDSTDIPDAPLKQGKETAGRAAPRGAGGRPTRTASSARPPSPTGSGVRLRISAGRRAGIRKQDLVGAIANESSVSGRQIGAIEIADGFSTVEVPADSVDEVITALRRTRIKGKRVQISLDAGPPKQ